MKTIEQNTSIGKILANSKPVEPILLIRIFNRQALNFEKARFGWMAILLTFQSCLGAVACMYLSQTEANLLLLALCAAVTMGSNALFIALAKPKVCLAAFYFSVIINTALLLTNLN